MRSNGGATFYTKVWKKGGEPNPAFLLLIHENPASRTSVNDIPNIVFFPNPASVPKFWRIALPQRQSNPVSRQYFPNAALCFGQIRFFLIFAPSPQSERLEPRLADVNITFAEFGIFLRIVDSTDVRFSQTSNWFSMTWPCTHFLSFFCRPS